MWRKRRARRRAHVSEDETILWKIARSIRTESSPLSGPQTHSREGTSTTLRRRRRRRRSNSNNRCRQLKHLITTVESTIAIVGMCRNRSYIFCVHRRAGKLSLGVHLPSLRPLRQEYPRMLNVPLSHSPTVDLPWKFHGNWNTVIIVAGERSNWFNCGVKYPSFFILNFQSPLNLKYSSSLIIHTCRYSSWSCI